VRTYLDPTAPIASDAILADDPKVAMDLAVAISELPRMSNLAHGLWGYYGTTREGAEVTVQSLGIGGPSAAAVMADLAHLGLARAIRIGSCIALEAGLQPGSSFVASKFEPRDGAGVALSEGVSLEPDPGLTRALRTAAGAHKSGPVRSTDVVALDAEPSGAPVLDQSSAAFAASCARNGISYACALVVAIGTDGSALSPEALDDAVIGLGRRAAAVLGGVPQVSGS
jgi:nucleoside phosphorylase